MNSLFRSPLFAPDDEPVQSPLPRRAGSLTLRQEETAQEAAMLDPANQSLADALNILLKLIYVGVGVLAGAYLLSGLARVDEGERGVALMFGKVSRADLEPGLHWSAPFPLGELERINQGVQEVNVDKEFWVFLQDDQRSMPLDSIAGAAALSLKPNQGGSGSNITGDGNLAHTRWAARYRRSDATRFSQNVLREQEQEVVRSAVMRGVVHACAQTPLDDLLRQSAGAGGTTAARAREVAQRTLDAMNSGITIELLTMTDNTAPLRVRKDFQDVQAAVSRGQQELESARTQATGTLNETAGDAAPYLVERIDAFELALASGEEKQAEAILADINAVLSGADVPANWAPSGKEAALGSQGAARRVSGRVTTLISEAKAYRTQVVSRSKSELAQFEAKLEQYRTNPKLMLTNEWAGAITTLLANPLIDKIYTPPGTQRDMLELVISRDPYFEREKEKAMKGAQARQASEEQQRRIRNQGIVTTTDNVTSQQNAPGGRSAQ